jgi:hypothetical protein
LRKVESVNNNDKLPPEILVKELPDGAEYVLPMRRLGVLLFFLAAALSVAAGGGLLFLFFWIVGTFVWPLGVVFYWFGLIVACICLLAALIVFLYGLWVLLWHSEIRLSGGRIQRIDRAGPFRWTRSRSLGRVRRLHVTVAWYREGDTDRGGWQPFSNLGVIRVECEGGRLLRLAPWYPRAWLLALAEDLARRWPPGTGLPGKAATSSPPTVIDEPTDPDADRPHQPSGSKARLEERADGLTLTVPAAGVWREGLFTTGLGACVVITPWIALLPGLLLGTIKISGQSLGRWESVLASGVMGLAWAGGIGMLLAGIERGRRRGVFSVAGGVLTAVQMGPLCRKRGEWSCDELAEVEVAPARLGPFYSKVNDRTVRKLWIRSKDGRTLGFLAGRQDAELQWIATVLRRALRRHDSQSHVGDEKPGSTRFMGPLPVGVRDGIRGGDEKPGSP